MNKFENNTITNNHDYFESEINKILNKAREQTGKKGLSKINDLENRMINMIKSGSKGSVINVAQMIACVGQQNVDGKRIAYGFDNRTLPHYVKYDDGPDSRGFVENSFISGLSPQEFFFHSMGGREGLIDTAVKTADTGYLQRKLIKAMEDCKISFDYTVRNASGSIVQFLYGEDGMDPIKIEAQSLPYIDMDYAKIRSEYLLSSQDDLEGITKHTKFVEEPFKKHFDQIVADREFMIVNIFKKRQNNSFMYPVSFSRIINNAKASMTRYGVDKATSDLSPKYVLDTINSLGDELFVSPNNKGNIFIQVLIRAYLSPKQVIVKHRFTKEVFDHMIQQVRHRFFDAIAHPSEMVGVVAAQSIGEPCTQLTLNTFHHSGISSASKAVRGVPRIKELLSVTKNMKGPAMTIYLKDDIKQEKMKSNTVLRGIQTTYFKDIVQSSKIYYDAHDFSTGIPEDQLFVQTYKELADLDLIKRPDAAPWLLRFEINRDKLLEEGLNMISLYNILQDYYDDTIACMFSDDNSNNLVFRLRLIEDNSEDRDYITELKALEKNIMDNIIIKGVKNVKKAMMNKQEYMLYNQETSQFEKAAEWVLDTSGTNLVDVMCYQGVDFTKTISNDINEIYDLLGVEAARAALYNELSSVISDAELYVNYRHMALLVDTMTNRGYLLSVDRHGINRVDIGPLAKCSFEETTDMLIKAGIFSEVDKITGVSANIMLGQIPPCGTGDTDILIDEHKLMNILDDHQNEPDEDAIVYEDMCTLDKLSFDFSMPAPNPKDVTQVKDFEIKLV
jgi:DNA-directed RNA polymerase II subunit RPB1